MFFETKSEASAECERLKARKDKFGVSLNTIVSGGRGGIRTHGTVTRTPDFELAKLPRDTFPSLESLKSKSVCK